MLARALGLVLVIGCSSPKPEPASPPAPVPALCRKAFDEGRYELSSKCFRELYVRTKDPAHLLLLGRSFELHADRSQAIDAYSEYVAHDAADPAERRTTEMRIQVLRERMAVAQSADLLYAQAQKLDEMERWEEAATAYQRYLYPKRDSLSYLERTKLELRNEPLRVRAGNR